jgi:hypothetical protein
MGKGGKLKRGSITKREMGKWKTRKLKKREGAGKESISHGQRKQQG